MPKTKVTAKKAFEINREIEKMIDERGIDPSKYSSDSKLFISKYTGYGGLHKFLNAAEAHSGILYEYYTPDPIIRKMWGLALKYGFDGGKVLEPAAGIGSFIGLAPDDGKMTRKINFTAIEPQSYSFKILNILYPNAETKRRIFEQEFIISNQSVKGKVNTRYDLVIGNPPYGTVSGTSGGRYFSMGENTYSKAKSYDEYFILRGLDVLKSEGLLMYIIGAEVASGGVPFLQKKQTKTKKMIAERADLIDAYRLPNGVFDRTDVLSDIVVFRKK